MGNKRAFYYLHKSKNHCMRSGYKWHGHWLQHRKHNKRNTEYFIYKVENKYHTRVVWSIIIKASTKKKKVNSLVSQHMLWGGQGATQ